VLDFDLLFQIMKEGILLITYITIILIQSLSKITRYGKSKPPKHFLFALFSLSYAGYLLGNAVPMANCSWFKWWRKAWLRCGVTLKMQSSVYCFVTWKSDTDIRLGWSHGRGTTSRQDYVASPNVAWHLKRWRLWGALTLFKSAGPHKTCFCNLNSIFGAQPLLNLVLKKF